MIREWTDASRMEIERILRQIEQRKANYWICDTKLDRIPQQQKLLDDMRRRLDFDIEDRKRYRLYYGGNGAWKTLVGSYITVLLALWTLTKKYKLPFIWAKKNIWILTKSGSNVKNTIEPYLLWVGSLTRIPEECVRKVHRDNWILKTIYLTNGAIISVQTYDMGRENLQGGNPDWVWMDEEPVDEWVFTELLVRLRTKQWEMLVTMTPLSGLTRLYSFFMEQGSWRVKTATEIYIVSSLDNPFIDTTWTEWLTEDEYRMRVLGSFESPTWLVYSSFYRPKNTIAHFDKNELWEGLRLYRSIDFGVSHPTGVIFLAQDLDDNFYVYDEIYRSNTLIEDISNEIKKKSNFDSFEYTLRDSAAKREGIELEKYWIKTIPADKHSKWENDVSNRRAWIMLVNQLLKDWKLIISQNCVNLIKEFETHYYKEGGKKDWEVVKLDDDLLDALRYIIFNIKKNSTPKRSILRREYNIKYAKWKSKLSSF